MTRWCERWNMKINAKKLQIIHVRNHQKPRCQDRLHCCGQELNYIPKYKYLGHIMHEHLSPAATVEALTSASSRSFGRVVEIF